MNSTFNILRSRFSTNPSSDLKLRPILLIFGFFIASQNLNAQYHNNAWLRGTFSFPIKSKLKLDAEVQHRRQNGFENHNLFDKNLMTSFRSWIHFQHSENLKISFSPFAYFSSNRIIQTHNDELANSNQEIRFTAALEFQRPLIKKIYFVNRSALEYRIFQNSPQNILRFRNRFGFRYDVNEKIKLLVFDEPLVILSKTSPGHFLDHNRLGFSAEYQPIPQFKIDVGYIYIFRKSQTTTNRFLENNFILNLTYRLGK